MLLAGRVPADADPAAQREALRTLASTVRLNLTLFSPDGATIASVGDRLPFPGAGVPAADGCPRVGGRWGVLRLPDGRWLVARQGRRLVHANVALILALLAVAVGIGAYPVARRLTRRLERLRTGVENLGAGDLKARVRVEGRDEVADLATSFNRAADRINRWWAHSARCWPAPPHELRSPIGADSRGSGADGGAERPDLRDRVAQDIAELDELIGELLLASRLQVVEQIESREDVGPARPGGGGGGADRGGGGDGDGGRRARGGRGSCGGWCATCSRTPCVTGRHRWKRRWRPAAGACACGSATAARACPRRSASGSSRPSTGRRRGPPPMRAPGWASPSCARSRAATAATCAAWLETAAELLRGGPAGGVTWSRHDRCSGAPA